MRVQLYGGSQHLEWVDVYEGDDDTDVLHEHYDASAGTLETYIKAPPIFQRAIGESRQVYAGWKIVEGLNEEANAAHYLNQVHTPPGSTRAFNENAACVDQALTATIDLSGGRRSPQWNGKQWVEFLIEGATPGQKIIHVLGDLIVSNTGCLFVRPTKYSTDLTVDVNGEHRRYHEWLPNFYFVSQWVVPIQTGNANYRFSHGVEGVTQS